MSPLFAVEAVDQSLAAWIVGVVALGIVGTLGFLVRNAFDGVQKGLEGLSAKMDGLKEAVHKSDGDRRVLEERVESLVVRMERLERSLEEAVVR